MLSARPGMSPLLRKLTSFKVVVNDGNTRLGGLSVA